MQTMESTAVPPASTAGNTSLPVVEVIAPASLRAGYTFDVEVNHQVYTVTVVRYFYIKLCK